MDSEEVEVEKEEKSGQSEKNVLELTPPATPPTPLPATSPSSSTTSCVDFQTVSKQLTILTRSENINGFYFNTY